MCKTNTGLEEFSHTPLTVSVLLADDCVSNLDTWMEAVG